MAKATIYKRAAAKKYSKEEERKITNESGKRGKEIMKDDGQIVSKME